MNMMHIKDSSYFDKIAREEREKITNLAEQTIAAVARVKDEEIHALKQEILLLKERLDKYENTEKTIKNTKEK